ncbi:carbohydrate kinase family protein [Candidatus Nomurabacteria bacterium]|nr:carbohydrate kinase family protein [Candidatus Nomurabacteria bacterium]
MNNEKIDFLAVGDIVTDAFIELIDAWIEIDNPDKSKELCMRFGDKIPYKDVVVVPAVGNSPNAAVSAHRLGLKSALVTDLGDDKFGIEQLETLKSKGIITDFVTTHKEQQSNYHYVLRYGPERTILVKHTEWRYKFPEIFPAPKFMYLSSLASNSLAYHYEIVEYLKRHPDTKLSFQPGTFQIKLGKEKMKDLYELSYLFFCNKEEAQLILGTKENDIKTLLKMMRDIGPKIPVITDGPKGAYVYDGTKCLFTPMYPDPKDPIDRTGAGDAFASTFTSALALGKKIEEALAWGPINSMNVVQYIGAQKGLLKREELEELLSKRPSEYVVREI